jgi:2-keto-3-deoxygluconate permease
MGRKGFPALLGVYLFCMGTRIHLKATPIILRRGAAILITKVGIASLIAVAVARLFNGNLWGLSSLAIMSAMNDTNGAMFVALTSSMGDENDVGSYVMQNIETGPFFTLLMLAGAGLANVPYMSMVSVIAPLAAGMLLGHLDKDFRELCGPSRSDLVLLFLAFALGNNIDLKAIVIAGPAGIGLGIATCVITGAACIVVDLLTGGRGIAGAAASSTAGNAAATPKAVALIDPTYAAVAPVATLQVAASVIVTAILTPLLTTMVWKRVKAKEVRTAAQSA